MNWGTSMMIWWRQKMRIAPKHKCWLKLLISVAAHPCSHQTKRCHALSSPGLNLSAMWEVWANKWQFIAHQQREHCDCTCDSFCNSFCEPACIYTDRICNRNSRQKNKQEHQGATNVNHEVDFANYRSGGHVQRPMHGFPQADSHSFCCCRGSSLSWRCWCSERRKQHLL